MAFDSSKHPRGTNPANTGGFSAHVHGTPETTLTRGTWPAHTSATVPWKSGSGRGPREDRMLTEVTVSLPPEIADLDYTPPRDLIPLLDAAARDITALDSGAGSQLQSLGKFLIRTESVASSKIEHIEASPEEYARALAGIKANESATSMVAAAMAIEEMVNEAGAGEITLASILDAHRTLMSADPVDGPHAGQLRAMQNWIGGSDYSPRGAVYVPPPADTVPPYMTDLLVFANRYDVPVLAQAAIVHAQFESIHPFTDGNGRIGRALINAVIRRRGLTTVVVVPIAAAMVARQQEYFDLVNGYRAAQVTPFIDSVARSAQIASAAATVSAARLHELPGHWDTLTHPRAGSAAARILDQLLNHPLLSADDAIQLTGASETSAYDAMDRLERDGVLHEVTARKRDRVWAATDVLAELEDLGKRIAAAAAQDLAVGGTA